MISKTLSTSVCYARLFDVAPDVAEFAQSLYPLLVAHADDFGREQGDIVTVKYRMHPRSPRSEQEFQRAMEALHDVGLIVWYEARGRRCYQIEKFDEHQSGLHKRTRSQFPAVPGISGNATDGKFPEVPGQENRREEKRTQRKRTEEESGADAPRPTDLMALWNQITKAPISHCRELSDLRKRAAKARLTERPLSEWREVIERIQASAFCRGDNDRDWRASFDWLLQPDTAVKVLEGKYDKRGKPSAEVAEHWRDECKRLHGGACLHLSHHQLEIAKAKGVPA